MIIPDISAWQVDWELPAGYETVTYSEGLENNWLTIINESFNKEFTVDDRRRGLVCAFLVYQNAVQVQGLKDRLIQQVYEMFPVPKGC